MTAVCYDLEGKRIWGFGIDDADADEHGVHSSPLLISGKLIVSTAKLVIALDAKTGVESWRVKPGAVGKSAGGSPLLLNVGGTDVFMTSSGDILRPSDAKRLWNPEQTLFGCPCLTPVCDKGIVYHCGGWASADYIALKLPETAAEELKPTIAYKAKPELPKVPAASFTFGRIASPLLNDGLLYHVTEGGALAVAEAATGKTVYTQMVEDFHARTTWVFYPGICCSPTLGGKHIYMMDDCGTTVVLEPGREFKKVAVNEFENMNAGGEQEQTLSTPIFEGTRMYFRSPGYLSCIGEK
jgi:outer membrane protein assembly factor BamB